MMYLSSTVGAFLVVAGEAAMGTEEATSASSFFVLSFLPKSGIAAALRNVSRNFTDQHACTFRDHNSVTGSTARFTSTSLAAAVPLLLTALSHLTNI